jgi:hypothetical protein
MNNITCVKCDDATIQIAGSWWNNIYLTSMAMKKDVIDKVNHTSFVLPFIGRSVISTAYAIII